MIEIPFWNDFYSVITPENKNEIIEHCMNTSLELPRDNFEWGDHCLSDKVTLSNKGFTELLNPYVVEVLSEIIEIPYSFKVDNVWKNTYHRYYHQEIHDHQGHELSFVIFMNDYQESDAKFYFVNERNRVTPSTWMDLAWSKMPDDIHISTKRGEILFFPSHMLHGVSPHLSDEPRITISGNISLYDLRQENPNARIIDSV